MLIASIGSWANSTSAISYTLRGQTKEPELRPHTAAIPNVDHGVGISESCPALQWMQYSTRKLNELDMQADSGVHGQQAFFLAAWKTERVKAVLRTVP